MRCGTPSRAVIRFYLTLIEDSIRVSIFYFFGSLPLFIKVQLRTLSFLSAFAFDSFPFKVSSQFSSSLTCSPPPPPFVLIADRLEGSCHFPQSVIKALRPSALPLELIIAKTTQVVLKKKTKKQLLTRIIALHAVIFFFSFCCFDLSTLSEGGGLRQRNLKY